MSDLYAIDVTEPLFARAPTVDDVVGWLAQRGLAVLVETEGVWVNRTWYMQPGRYAVMQLMDDAESVERNRRVGVEMAYDCDPPAEEEA